MPPENTIPPDVSPAASSSGEPMQSVPESSAPTVEIPAPAVEPVAPLQEATSTPETAPDSAEATTGTQVPTQTAQIPPNEPFDPAHDKPLPPKVDPFDSAQDKPIPPPSAAAASMPAPIAQQTGILSSAREILVKARVALQDRKRKKRDKIMQLLATKTANGSTSSPQVTNDEVEKLLHVSDATAARYLSVLVKEGKIRKVGTAGSGVAYTKL